MEFSRLEYSTILAFLFSRGSSQPRDQTQVYYTAGRFFTDWTAREAQEILFSIGFKNDLVLLI